MIEIHSNHLGQVESKFAILLLKTCFFTYLTSDNHLTSPTTTLAMFMLITPEQRNTHPGRNEMFCQHKISCTVVDSSFFLGGGGGGVDIIYFLVRCLHS